MTSVPRSCVRVLPCCIADIPAANLKFAAAALAETCFLPTAIMGDLRVQQLLIAVYYHQHFSSTACWI